MKNNVKTIKFDQKFIDPILNGQKTQTRRLIKKYDTTPMVNTDIEFKYSVGDRVAICDQSGNQAGVIIEITGHRIEAWNEVSDEDLKAEAMEREEYLSYMSETYEEIRKDKLGHLFAVFVYEFKVIVVALMPAGVLLHGLPETIKQTKRDLFQTKFGSFSTDSFSPPKNGQNINSKIIEVCERNLRKL